MEYRIEDLEKLTVKDLTERCKILGVKGIYNIRKSLLLQKLISYYCTHEPKFPYLLLCFELREEIAKKLNTCDILSLIRCSKTLYDELGRSNDILWKNIIYKSISNDIIYDKHEYTYCYDLVKEFVSKKNNFKKCGQYLIKSYKESRSLQLLKYILDDYKEKIVLNDQDITRLAQFGTVEVFKYLTINKECNLNMNKRIDQHPFFVNCIWKGNYELFSYLCNQGIYVRYGNDLVMSVSPVPSLPFIKLLHEKGCILSSYNNILLKNSFKQNNFEVAEYCLNNGVMIEEDCIIYALEGGNPKIINLLLERNIIIDTCKYKNVFIDSIKEGKCNTIRCFVNILGFGLHDKDILNEGLLESAVGGYYVIAKILIEAGADISYQNYKALEEAKKGKWYGTYEYLLSISNKL